ncbi:transketolase [Desulfomarina sp.]
MASQKQLANALRVLSVDSIERAGSGHPGAPMGMADIAEVLWNRHLKHNPANPSWSNRDRFILSNGHASMLLYSLLHLSGYDLSINDLKNFRRLRSKTPGHPEHGYTPGVETTSGPLGQGIANGVGMALAERTLAAQFNRPGHEIVDHFTYVFMGDGCMMEGVSAEACSLAGTLKLGKLIVFWDDNRISIDDHTDGWFTEDVATRFSACGWQVIRDIDGHDPEIIDSAIRKAKNSSDKPTLICCRTTIGSGSPALAGSHLCHGAPLGPEEREATCRNLGWTSPPFEIPEEIYSAWDCRDRGAIAEQLWQEKFNAYNSSHPELATEYLRRISGELPVDWDSLSSKFIKATSDKRLSLASRAASRETLEGFGPLLPELFGGSADLTPSNLTSWSGSSCVNNGNIAGNYLSYGVREFGMAAIMNGMALHGGFIPYGGTFLMFSDYARNALRMAALMKLRSIYVFTHDSIGLGEDGPTHQPIEQLPSLRMIPNMDCWRPCDGVETAAAWKAAIEKKDGPTSLILSRQTLEHHDRNETQMENISRGGYILLDCESPPEVILLATGSEVSLAMEAAKICPRNLRVVSMVCTTLFDRQDLAYREAVLPSAVTARVAVEAAVPDGWFRYVGLRGKVIGINRFGESAPAQQLFEQNGFTVPAILAAIEDVVA